MAESIRPVARGESDLPGERGGCGVHAAPRVFDELLQEALVRFSFGPAPFGKPWGRGVRERWDVGSGKCELRPF